MSLNSSDNILSLGQSSNKHIILLVFYYKLFYRLLLWHGLGLSPRQTFDSLFGARYNPLDLHHTSSSLNLLMEGTISLKVRKFA